MNTFVWREILDNSISGDKIFGGTINWIDGIYTDQLVVPHDSGGGGVGSIDGTAFTIGITERITSVEAISVLARGLFVWSSDYSGYAATLNATQTQYGTLNLNSATSLNVFLTANLSSRSYHIPKLIIGTSTEKSSAYKFEVPNDSSYLDYLYGLYINYTTAYFSDLIFQDHLSTWVDIKDYTQLTDYMALGILDGGVGPLLHTTLQELIDSVTSAEVSQLATIGNNTISSSNWDYVRQLTQNVGVGADAVFGTINGSDIDASGDITAVGSVEGSKLIETSGGMALVPGQHRDIKGLHLDWHHPLVLATTSIRIVAEEGECIDSSKTVRMSLTSNMTKRLNATWAAGDGNGGRAVALTTDTYYWVHLIYNSSGGAVDVGFDTSGTAANLLAASGYTHYRTLGRVYWSAGATLNFFEEIAHYYYTDRPVRSGFTVLISSIYVITGKTLYAGAERLGKFATIWIQEGSDTSINAELKYDIVSPRPSSIDSLTEVSSAPCNFLGGYSGDKVLPGEIVLNTTNSFLCKVFTSGTGAIAHNSFGNAALKGLRENTAFTLYLYTNT